MANEFRAAVEPPRRPRPTNPPIRAARRRQSALLFVSRMLQISENQRTAL
jgi:hypothetical protein